MKKIVFILAIISLVMRCNAQSELNVNNAVIETLKKDRFNFEIFELAFCLNEIFSIIENDSTYYNIWASRINQAFNNKQKEELLYVHSIEYKFLKYMMSENISLKGVYPNLYIKLQQIKPVLTAKEFPNFSKVFNDYIEYPEQVDNICLILLICEINCQVFDDITNDKIALWKYNNWINYGFEEFRYYPGTLNNGKKAINNRIINYIMNNKHCQGSPLVNKSFIMIKSTVEKY
jgi:hypothetical protein